MKRMKGDPHYLFELFTRLYRMVFLMEVTDVGYRYVQVSEQGKLASSLPNDVEGRYLHEMYRSEVANELIEHYDAVVETGDPVYFMSKMNIDSNTARFASSMLVPIEDESGVVRYVLSLTTDLSEEAEIKLLRSIEHMDYLTGMPNLMKVKLDLDQLFEQQSTEETSVMRLHINRFKMMMSLQGVERSNELIKDITRQLANTLPKGSIIGRVDGEDFVAVLPHVPIKMAYMYAEHLLDVIAGHSYRVADAEFPLSSCIGIGSGTSDADRVIMNASTALLEARQTGNQTIRLYEHDEYVQRYIDEIMIETELVKAIKQDELYMVYQPKVSMDGSIHFEALIRWNSPVLGFVSPETFIRVAEQSLLIEDVTQFVMNRVCQDVSTHPEQFEGRRVAVNVSPNLFHEHHMNELVTIVASYDLQPEQFEFEVTEHTLMHEPVAAIKTVESLKQQGFRLVIDDFGVSYSSLNYLKLFEIDGIKIDRSFVAQLDQENGLKEYEIVKLIVSLAKKLDLEVTAEGVETEEQYRILRQLGCDEIQGYFFSRPMALEDLGEALEILYSHQTVLSKIEQPSHLLHPALDEREMKRLKAILRLEILNTPQEERFDRISRLVAQMLQMPVSFISIMTTDQQWFKSCVGIELGSSHLKREWTLCNRVVTSERSMVIEDVAAEEFESDSPWLEQVGFYAGVPLRTKQGHVIGTLCVVDTQARTFTEENLHALESFTHWVMTEIEHTEVSRRQIKRQQVVESLYEATALRMPFQDQLARVQEILLEWVGYSHAVIFSIESSHRLLVENGVSRLTWGEEELRSLHQLTTVGSQTLQEGELIVDGIEFTTLVSFPLTHKHQVFGWIVLLAEQGNLNDQLDEETLQELTDTIRLLARWLENGIRKERKQREMIQIATQDQLTKLCNRYTLMTDLYKQMQRSKVFALLFIDVDDFKRINDQFGYLIGDEMLIEIAQRLNEFVETFGGQVYRFSADEFVVVQEESPIGLNEINDTISRGIVASNGEEVRLTVSVGVATVQPASTIDSILQQADAAMYIAKNNGGDQWFQYDGYLDDEEF
ncbi:EAL domain-containing protein [Exiguobacterium aestuarii]|uniref:EAL domain-containing protein n=1 Tax=Exiguobacterium aestuarii TaxID=273527 RepID=A0ABW2PQV3_9BACL|nr:MULTISPECIES: EAL domain-containing protein [Exiguobacterium]MCT4785163.1 EAL domain-containing protein [Exiguobacterium aestuarii]